MKPFRKERGRAQATLRTLRLLMFLNGRREWSMLLDLAKTFHCSKRTVCRDLLVLRQLGADIAWHKTGYSDRIEEQMNRSACRLRWAPKELIALVEKAA